MRKEEKVRRRENNEMMMSAEAKEIPEIGIDDDDEMVKMKRWRWSVMMIGKDDRSWLTMEWRYGYGGAFAHRSDTIIDEM